ncbi:MAG: GNAT family N-acetyltransferase [Bacteroidia bacterium]|nr:GNAT family N-acetyltransferase [Bacteroidia bacterium]
MIDSRPQAFPLLSTPRLMLRALNLSDDRTVFALHTDLEVTKYLDRPLPVELAGAREFIQKINRGVERGEWYYWAMALKDQPEMIGTICLWNLSLEREKADVGFELLPAFQGKGYMQEALETIIQFAFRKLDMQVIRAYTHAENEKSIRILQRNGFQVLKHISAEEDPDGVPAILFELLPG